MLAADRARARRVATAYPPDMTQARMRPEFADPLHAEPPTFYAALDEAVRASDGRFRGTFFRDGALLRLREADRHVWSPALHLFVTEDERGGVAARTLHGRFSPSSPVWTAFVAIYLGLACVGIAAACYGTAQWTIGQAPWALVGVPITLALVGFTYGAAIIGQGLGADEMYALRSLVDHVRETLGTDEQA